MTNRIQRFIAFLLVLCIPIFAIAGCTNNDVANAANQVTTNANGTYSIDTKTTTPEGKLDVYMLDIGQGDAILLKVGDEYSMIDTGDIEHRENIVAQLKTMGVTKLKNIIITILMLIIWVVSMLLQRLCLLNMYMMMVLLLIIICTKLMKSGLRKIKFNELL